jgi:hypothetical protein
MKTKTLLMTLVTTILGLLCNSYAQWGMDYQQWEMHMSTYNQHMDQWLQQQMQQLQMQSDQQYAQIQRFFIDYYRQHTGDYTTPDQHALVLGDKLYCQHNPVKCQQNAQYADAMSQISAAGHAQRINDIHSWGNTQNQIGQTYSDILDINQQGYQNRTAVQDFGQRNYVQGAIHGESTYYNQNGMGYSLPVYPDPTTSYRTPDGYPLAFNYQTNTWYQGDGFGWWTPLRQQ